MTTTPDYYAANRYVRHNLEGGPVFAYPLEAVARLLTDEERQDYGIGRTTSYGHTVTLSGPYGGGLEWTAETLLPEDSPSGAPRFTGGVARDGWLLSDFRADAIVMSWNGPSTRGPWRKRAERPEDAFAGAMWDSAPDEPGDELRWRMDSSDWDEDGEAVVGHRVYVRELIPGARRTHRFDVSDWRPLETTQGLALDQADRNRWTVDDPSLLAIYGRHTAHLWPGTLSGLRDAVADALEAHPQVRNSPGGGQVFRRPSRDGELAVSFTWFYDGLRDRTTATLGRRKGAHKDGGMWVKTERSQVGQSRHISRKVPDRVAGTSLRDALDRWDDTVARYRREFLPDEDEVLGCSACGAQGWRTKTDAGTAVDVVALASALDADLRDPENTLTTEDLVRRTTEVLEGLLGKPLVGHGGE
jgi:hypothetical protein